MVSLPRIDSLESGRNRIINGDFTLWQRGTSFASPATATYSADRWKYYKNGGVVHTISRSTDVPTLLQSGYQSRYSLRIEVTTADASLASSDYSYLTTILEGYDYQTIHGRPVGIQFWIKSGKTGQYSLALGGGSPRRSYVVPFTINDANTWERKFVPLTMDNLSTYSFDHTSGLDINIVLSSGSAYQTAQTGQWLTADVNSTAANVNFSDTIGNALYLAQVMLVDADFTYNPSPNLTYHRVGRSFQGELSMAQRYYEKSFALETTPATNAGMSEVSRVAAFGPTIQGQTWATDVFFKVQKRVVPTITPYNANSAANNWEWTDTNISTTTGWVLQFAGRNSFIPRKDGATATFTWAMGHWTADAEL